MKITLEDRHHDDFKAPTFCSCPLTRAVGELTGKPAYADYSPAGGFWVVSGKRGWICSAELARAILAYDDGGAFPVGEWELEEASGDELASMLRAVAAFEGWVEKR